jgi:hypothetical protein
MLSRKTKFVKNFQLDPFSSLAERGYLFTGYNNLAVVTMVAIDLVL